MPAAPTKPEIDLRPLYAMAGLTDLVASTLRDRVAHNRDETLRRWAELKEKAPTLPQATVHRLISLPGQASSYLAEAENRYGQLADRGRTAVNRLPVPPWVERFVPTTADRPEATAAEPAAPNRGAEGSGEPRKQAATKARASTSASRSGSKATTGGAGSTSTTSRASSSKASARKSAGAGSAAGTKSAAKKASPKSDSTR